MELNSLVILGNEFCNYNCEHCLRGPSRNNRMTRETLEKFLSQVSSIYEVTFTGGEITLYLEPIRWFIDICREKDIYVGGFYIVTNGHKYVPEFIELCDELYDFCEDNEISGLAISDDPYHRKFQPDNFEQIIIQYQYPEASFGEREWWNPREYFRENDKKWTSNISLINEGNAKTNMIGERECLYYTKGEVDDVADLDMILLRHNGDLFSSCDLSYNSMDETMGPYCYDCPISILNLLSETDSEYALKWRQKCWDNHNQKKNPNGVHKLPENSVIKVIMPFDTTYCKEGQEVMLFKKKWGKRSKWFMKNTNVYFTQGLMKSVTENGFEIIQRGE